MKTFLILLMLATPATASTWSVPGRGRVSHVTAPRGRVGTARGRVGTTRGRVGHQSSGTWRATWPPNSYIYIHVDARTRPPRPRVQRSGSTRLRGHAPATVRRTPPSRIAPAPLSDRRLDPVEIQMLLKQSQAARPATGPVTILNPYVTQ